MPPRSLEEGWAVRPAAEDDLPALLPLVRAYADFYESTPTDEGLETMCRTLIAGPVDEGVLLSGCDPSGAVVGFAAMGWKWSSLRGAKIGYLEDLFVAPEARGSGLADALIEACALRAREYGAPALDWLTAPDNKRAQAVYDRSGAVGELLIEYDLEL
jgi:ribosomal protein S18 acetylase RimI-like enzyme